MANIRRGYLLRCTIFISFLGGFTVRSQDKALGNNHGFQEGAETSNGQGTNVREAFQVDNDADTVTWTGWTEWSTCTKTCGFGISIRTRECVNEAGLKSGELSEIEGGRTSGCLGAYKEIQTCNTQLCPTGIATPRESQCEEFNNKAFMGRQYQWEAFINPQGKCELTCRAKGFRFYARLAATVADGTPCTPGSTDVCIAGECKKVGCDGIVGSNAIMDVCGKCRGDNSTCIVKLGVFTTETLIQGYNTVLNIPTGAANINISEVRSSSNFLAIRTSENKYILNGPRDLSSIGEYFGAGTKFTYNKNVETWCPGQCFFALGPIDQPLEVQILFYHRNPGLRYRYSVPIEGIFSKPQEGIIPTADEGQQFETEDTDLRGYLSDSREIQNDARRGQEQRRVRHTKNISKSDKSSLPLPKYSQSFTYGRSSALNDRYRHMTSAERSTDHKVGHSSRSNGGYPNTRNRQHYSSDGSVHRTSHHSAHQQNTHAKRTNTAVSRSDDRHSQRSRHAQRLAHEARLREQHRAREHAARNRERDLRNREADSRNRQTDSRYRQTDPSYQYPETRYQETDRNPRTRNHHNRRTGEVDYQQRTAGNRHTSNNHVDNNGRNTPSTSHASRGSLVQRSRQTHGSVYDTRTGQVGLHATRRQGDLSIKKQPVFVNRQSGSGTSNRALTDSSNQNRIPLSETLNNNRNLPRLDTRGSSRDIWRQNQVADLEYSWKTSGLTECSESCGGGYQQSVVVCVKKTSQVTVTGENCEHMVRPERHTVICNQKPCPADWVPSDWGPCTVSCGGGVQSRQVICKRRISPELTLAVSANDCAGKDKPPSQQRCGEENCFQWTVGNWTKCSTSCGKGERTREVVCQSVDSSVVGENDCLRGSRKPLDREVCDMGSCGTGWFYTPWPTECSASCGEGKQNRKIHCAGPRGEAFPDERCKQFHKPEITKTCKTEIPCGGKWFTGPWSQCNTTCGEGKQTRDVVCMKKLNTDFFTVVDEENCVSTERPELHRPCPNILICLPEWYMKDWGECSASCGTGYRTREVKCLDVERSASPDCLVQDKPIIRESCNTQSCHQRRHRPTNDGCKDTYSSCHLVVQARLCRYRYYQKVCCDSCVQSGQLNR